MGIQISYNPAPTEPCISVRTASKDPEGLPKGTSIKILSWNLQYCAGRDHLFFYEGGNAVQVPLPDIEKTMKVVAEIIAEYNPDIVLLQEADRNSKRSHYQDELLGILRHLDEAGHIYPYIASTPYHQCAFVPTPITAPMGKVDLHLACLSKYPIQTAVRHQLPLLNESWVRQQFNLKRALMEVRIAVQGGGEFVVFNTHLSAFAFNDGTPEREIAMLDEHMSQCEEENVPWVLAGDFNMLAPGDKPERFGIINNSDHSSYYNNEKSPIEELCKQYKSALDLEAYAKHPTPHNTYLPLGTDIADRVLDWFFVGKNLAISKYEVLSNHHHVSLASDHLPMLLEVQANA